MQRSEVFKLITKERKRQDAMGRSIEAKPHEPATWLFIAQAEMDEAKHACLKLRRSELVTEVVQTAAVLVAMLEQLADGEA